MSIVKIKDAELETIMEYATVMDVLVQSTGANSMELSPAQLSLNVTAISLQWQHLKKSLYDIADR